MIPPLQVGCPQASALVHDAAPADRDATAQRLEPRARVDHALGADDDGVRAREEGAVGDGAGRGELHGGLGAGLGDGGKDGVSFVVPMGRGGAGAGGGGC